MADKPSEEARRVDDSGEVEPPVNRRGRPRIKNATPSAVGTADTSASRTTAAEEPSVSSEAASVSVVAPRAPRGTGRIARATASAKAKAEAAALASTLTLVANSLAVTALGESAAMTDTERVLIDLGLPPVLERLSVEQAAKFVAIANPMLLLFGVGLWGLRLSVLAGEQTKSRSAKTSQPVVPSVAPAVETPPLPTSESVKVTASGFGVSDERVLYQQEPADAYI